MPKPKGAAGAKKGSQESETLPLSGATDYFKRHPAAGAARLPATVAPFPPPLPLLLTPPPPAACNRCSCSCSHSCAAAFDAMVATAPQQEDASTNGKKKRNNNPGVRVQVGAAPHHLLSTAGCVVPVDAFSITYVCCESHAVYATAPIMSACRVAACTTARTAPPATSAAKRRQRSRQSAASARSTSAQSEISRAGCSGSRPTAAAAAPSTIARPYTSSPTMHSTRFTC